VILTFYPLHSSFACFSFVGVLVHQTRHVTWLPRNSHNSMFATHVAIDCYYKDLSSKSPCNSFSLSVGFEGENLGTDMLVSFPIFAIFEGVVVKVLGL
jgi:hypothetical protein